MFIVKTGFFFTLLKHTNAIGKILNKDDFFWNARTFISMIRSNIHIVGIYTCIYYTYMYIYALYNKLLAIELSLKWTFDKERYLLIYILVPTSWNDVFYCIFFYHAVSRSSLKIDITNMGQGISLYLKIEAKNKHAIMPPTYLLMFTNNPSSGCLRGPLSTLTNVDTRSFLPMSKNACFKNHKSISSGPHLMIAFLSRRSKKSRMFSFSFRLFLLTRSFARKVRIRKSSQFILS